LKQLPPGITPPLVIKYSASSIPVIQLGLSSADLPEQSVFDASVNFLRPQLVTIPGCDSVPVRRQVKARFGRPRHQRACSRGLTPADVVNALNVQNLILPSGTAKFGPTEYTVN
jgi:multidrug efflux pump subunit AcrB